MPEDAEVFGLLALMEIQAQRASPFSSSAFGSVFGGWLRSSRLLRFPSPPAGGG